VLPYDLGQARREPPGQAAASAGSTDLTRKIAARVEAAPLRTRPFEHIYLEGIFSPAYYQRLIELLPAPGRYREFRHRDAMQPDGHSARRKFYLFPEHLLRLPAEQRAFWAELSRALCSRTLQDTFKRKFRAPLERRFGRSIDRLLFYPVPMLLRDVAGYRIGIHGDSLRKAITVQFYLPRDDSQANQGTILHEGRNGEAARRTTRLSFRPATAYAFPVVYHESWHSVASVSGVGGARNSLMLTYYVQEGLVDRLAQRLGRLWRFIVYPVRR
jgi:hypothetical protein